MIVFVFLLTTEIFLSLTWGEGGGSKQAITICVNSLVTQPGACLICVGAINLSGAGAQIFIALKN